MSANDFMNMYLLLIVIARMNFVTKINVINIHSTVYDIIVNINSDTFIVNQTYYPYH